MMSPMAKIRFSGAYNDEGTAVAVCGIIIRVSNDPGTQFATAKSKNLIARVGLASLAG
jgi:hypothetical protein